VPGHNAVHLDVLHRIERLTNHCYAWFLVRFSMGRLVHDFNLIGVHGKAKAAKCCADHVHAGFHDMLRSDTEGVVISKKEVADDCFLHLCISWQVPWVVQFPVSPVFDQDN